MSGNNKVSVNFRLYAHPSTTEGIARLMDFSGTLNTYNASKTENEADLRAMCHDWVSVGADLYHAIEEYAVDNNYHVVFNGGEATVTYTGHSNANQNSITHYHGEEKKQKAIAS